MKQYSITYTFLIAVLLFLFSCSGSEQGGIQQISFSRDTVLFDTVFTNMGSSTEVFLVINNGSSSVTFTDIFIPSGNGSVYRMNVSGYTGNTLTDIELDGNDSIYVFVEVTLDPNGGNTPLIHTDSIVFTINGNSKNVQLAAFGQDANYFYPTDTLSSGLQYSVIPCNTSWKPGKPIVIVGWAVIDENCLLQIEAGTQIYFFNNGALWVYPGGTLQVNGELNNPVVFQGTRMGYEYENNPGQWDRILINEGSSQNYIHNAIIKNGYIGLQCDNFDALGGTLGTPTGLELKNVVVKNMSGIGIFSRNYNITGYNSLVTNCGQYVAAFTYGGTVKFYHSTFANYWSGSTRNFPSLFVNNYFFDGASIYSDDLNFEFNNGIVYGNVENEFGFDSVVTSQLNFRFDHSLIRIDPEEPTDNTNRYFEIIKNQDPLFFDAQKSDFRLNEGSPAINIGSKSFVQQFIPKLLFDLKGSNRTMSGNPDAGAYEF